MLNLIHIECITAVCVDVFFLNKHSQKNQSALLPSHQVPAEASAEVTQLQKNCQAFNPVFCILVACFIFLIIEQKCTNKINLMCSCTSALRKPINSLHLYQCIERQQECQQELTLSCDYKRNSKFPSLLLFGNQSGVNN